MVKIIKCVFIIVLLGFAVCGEDTYDAAFDMLFKVKHLKTGDNTNFPQQGDIVTVHYIGTFPDTGKVFDSSVGRNKRFEFTLGVMQVIPCWDEVVRRMSKGEKISVICPARFAYGANGAGSMIPPNTDIAFEIELFEFKSDNYLFLNQF